MFILYMLLFSENSWEWDNEDNFVVFGFIIDRVIKFLKVLIFVINIVVNIIFKRISVIIVGLFW